MPNAALQATERQFLRLLRQAAGNVRIDLHCFSLPSVHRSQTAKWRVDRQYTDIAELGRRKFDGLIVTGAEPNAATLPEEPFWRDLADIIDWAEANTRSTIWSCLAAHAAVLHFDSIERQRLGAARAASSPAAPLISGRKYSFAEQAGSRPAVVKSTTTSALPAPRLSGTALSLSAPPGLPLRSRMRSRQVQTGRPAPAAGAPLNLSMRFEPAYPGCSQARLRDSSKPAHAHARI